MRARLWSSTFGCLLGAAACGESAREPIPHERAVVATSLSVDVSSREATAILDLSPALGDQILLEAHDLDILDVRGPDGALSYDVGAARLDVELPGGEEPAQVTIDYRYELQEPFQGATADYTLLWPYYCGYLFPCDSDPSRGVHFELTLSGVEEGLSAVYPPVIPEAAPSYMIAWALGSYEHMDLGVTAAGTRVGVYHFSGQEPAAELGTAHLRDAFEWFEETYGPYPFGDEVASVAVRWGLGAFGGMEHHPFWHVASAAFDHEETHVHEAAHGWFGNGIRIACWEDFVLSEGTTSYVTARAIAAVAGDEAAAAVWSSYQSRLSALQAGSRPKIAWPAGCGEIDILEDGLFGTAPYMKGAFFFRALEEKIGAAALDAALASFYADHVGRAATMQDLLDRVERETGYDPTPCALAWLRQDDLPEGESCE